MPGAVAEKLVQEYYMDLKSRFHGKIHLCDTRLMCWPRIMLAFEELIFRCLKICSCVLP